jgi:hypothetical protein
MLDPAQILETLFTDKPMKEPFDDVRFMIDFDYLVLYSSLLFYVSREK